METIPFPANSIKLPISPAQQGAIVDWFLNSNALPLQHNSTTLSNYFRYLVRQCYQAAHFTSIESYEEMMDIARRMKSLESKETILSALMLGPHNQQEHELEALCEGSIDLTVRALLMLDVGELKNAYTGRRPLIWNAGTLSGFIQQMFPSTTILDHDGIRLGGNFTAKNLSKIAGIRIDWTPNLANHLRVTDSGKYHTVSIFHHAAFLQYQLQ